jgi:hypothetical protein
MPCGSDRWSDKDNSVALAAGASGGPIDGGHADCASHEPAQRMRSVTAGLRDELHAAAACHTRSAAYEHCVLPALRHTAMGGRTAAFVLRTVINTTADPPCRAYLLELGAANSAASEQAQWTIQQLYDRSRHDRRRRAAKLVRTAAAMLTRAAAPRASKPAHRCAMCSPPDGH